MKHNTGFSLVEIFISLLLLTILLRIGNPGLFALVATTRSESALLTLHDTIALARSRAVLDRTTVTICGSEDQVHCSRNWNRGLLVFTDENANGLMDNGDELVTALALPDTQGDILWRAFQNRKVLQIDSVGRTRHQNGSFTYCHVSGDAHLTRQLVVSRTARLRYARDSDGDGVVEGSDGKPVRCP